MAPNQEKKDLESDKKDQSKLPEPKVVIQKVVEGSIEGQVADQRGPNAKRNNLLWCQQNIY